MATKAEHLTELKAQYPTLTKMVDGVSSTLTSAEYEARMDEWATGQVASDIRAILEADGGESANYIELRTSPQVAGSYPSIPDQLDKLYHDIDDGKLDKTGTWYLAIKATKDKFPKPS
jgi:hypothetical protein